MITKMIILFAMISIVGFLISGLIFLTRDSGSSKRTVSALTLRISFSVSLFLFLFIAFKLGFIKPHGILGSNYV